MTIKAFLKNAIQNSLAAFGWRLSRLEPGVLDKENRRIVWRAFYRGRSFLCFKGDVITDYLLTGRGFEEQLPEILRSCQDKARTDVIEVGANIGTTFVTLAKDFPHLQFHCVEPVPEFFALLQENAKTYEAVNAKLYPIALGAAPKQQLQIHTLLGTAGAIKRFDGYTSDVLSVESSTMDDVFAVAKPCLIKIDVDGFELEVLRGAKNLLKTWRPLLYLEYDIKLMQRAGYTSKDLAQLLESLGYRSIRAWDTTDKLVGDFNSFADLAKFCADMPFHVNILLTNQGP